MCLAYSGVREGQKGCLPRPEFPGGNSRFRHARLRMVGSHVREKVAGSGVGDEETVLLADRSPVPWV